MERFILTEGLDLDPEQPYPGGAKAHFAKGQPVAVNTGGRLFTLIRAGCGPRTGAVTRLAGRAAGLRN